MKEEIPKIYYFISLEEGHAWEPIYLQLFRIVIREAKVDLGLLIFGKILMMEQMVGFLTQDKDIIDSLIGLR